MDLRVQKTYAALFRAFQELLEEKSFEEITVKELCDRAVIRTATFYKHFTDKYDFFSFMVRELRQSFHTKIQEDSSSTAEEYCLAVIRNSIDFASQHRELLRAADADSIMNLIVDSTSNCMSDELVERLRRYQAQGGSLPADPGMTADLLVGAVGRVVRNWLKSGKPESPEELTESLKPFVHRVICG